MTDDNYNQDVDQLNDSHKSHENKKGLPSKGRLFIMLGVVLVIVVGTLMYINYQNNEFNRGQMKIHDAFVEYEERLYEKAKEDDVGGETPQETLDMFIEAVEEEDYELASDYFVIGKKEEMLETLKGMKKNYLLSAINSFKSARPTDYSSGLDLNNKNINKFTMEAEINNSPPYVIEFQKYPSGVWKILEM